MSGGKTTAGNALWNLERPLSDFPNRKPWDDLKEDDRDRYEWRASGILFTAAKLMEAVYADPNRD